MRSGGYDRSTRDPLISRIAEVLTVGCLRCASATALLRFVGLPCASIALTLVRVIERHSDKLAAELVTKLGASLRTADLRKVPVEELQRQIEEVLGHLSEWLLTKTAYDIERRYLELGERRASQGVALSDFCWAVAVTKEHLSEFLERQGFRRGPVEICGEMELLRLLDQFFDRALCFATEGYEQYLQLQK